MAAISNANLTLTTTGNTTTVNVVYKATFSPFERFLASKGMRFQEKIAVQGVDGAVGTVIINFISDIIPVTDGTTDLVVTRNRSRSVLRSVLQEDTAPGDTDEIRCKISIEPIGMPALTEQLTEVESLVG